MTARASSARGSTPADDAARGAGHDTAAPHRRARARGRRSRLRGEPRRQDARGPLRDREEGRRRRHVVRLPRAATSRRDERYAIKVLSAALSQDTNAMARLRREASLGMRLAHPNVCHIIRLGETEDGLVYVVMPFVEGEMLVRPDQPARPPPARRGRAARARHRDRAQRSRTSSRSCIAISSRRT